MSNNNSDVPRSKDKVRINFQDSDPKKKRIYNEKNRPFVLINSVLEDSRIKDLDPNLAGLPQYSNSTQNEISNSVLINNQENSNQSEYISYLLGNQVSKAPGPDTNSDKFSETYKSSTKSFNSARSTQNTASTGQLAELGIFKVNSQYFSSVSSVPSAGSRLLPDSNLAYFPQRSSYSQNQTKSLNPPIKPLKMQTPQNEIISSVKSSSISKVQYSRPVNKDTIISGPRIFGESGSSKIENYRSSNENNQFLRHSKSKSNPINIISGKSYKPLPYIPARKRLSDGAPGSNTTVDNNKYSQNTDKSNIDPAPSQISDKMLTGVKNNVDIIHPTFFEQQPNFISQNFEQSKSIKIVSNESELGKNIEKNHSSSGSNPGNQEYPPSKILHNVTTQAYPQSSSSSDSFKSSFSQIHDPPIPSPASNQKESQPIHPTLENNSHPKLDDAVSRLSSQKIFLKQIDIQKSNISSTTSSLASTRSSKNRSKASSRKSHRILNPISIEETRRSSDFILQKSTAPEDIFNCNKIEPSKPSNVAYSSGSHSDHLSSKKNSNFIKHGSSSRKKTDEKSQNSKINIPIIAVNVKDTSENWEKNIATQTQLKTQSQVLKRSNSKSKKSIKSQVVSKTRGIIESNISKSSGSQSSKSLSNDERANKNSSSKPSSTSDEIIGITGQSLEETKKSKSDSIDRQVVSEKILHPPLDEGQFLLEKNNDFSNIQNLHVENNFIKAGTDKVDGQINSCNVSQIHSDFSIDKGPQSFIKNNSESINNNQKMLDSENEIPHAKLGGRDTSDVSYKHSDSENASKSINKLNKKANISIQHHALTNYDYTDSKNEIGSYKDQPPSIIESVTTDSISKVLADTSPYVNSPFYPAIGIEPVDLRVIKSPLLKYPDNIEMWVETTLEDRPSPIRDSSYDTRGFSQTSNLNSPNKTSQPSIDHVPITLKSHKTNAPSDNFEKAKVSDKSALSQKDDLDSNSKIENLGKNPIPQKYSEITSSKSQNQTLDPKTKKLIYNNTTKKSFKQSDLINLNSGDSPPSQSDDAQRSISAHNSTSIRNEIDVLNSPYLDIGITPISELKKWSKRSLFQRPPLGFNAQIMANTTDMLKYIVNASSSDAFDPNMSPLSDWESSSRTRQIWRYRLVRRAQRELLAMTSANEKLYNEKPVRDSLIMLGNSPIISNKGVFTDSQYSYFNSNGNRIIPKSDNNSKSSSNKHNTSTSFGSSSIYDFGSPSTSDNQSSAKKFKLSNGSTQQLSTNKPETGTKAISFNYGDKSSSIEKTNPVTEILPIARSTISSTSRYSYRSNGFNSIDESYSNLPNLVSPNRNKSYSIDSDFEIDNVYEKLEPFNNANSKASPYPYFKKPHKKIFFNKFNSNAKISRNSKDFSSNDYYSTSNKPKKSISKNHSTFSGSGNFSIDSTDNWWNQPIPRTLKSIRLNKSRKKSHNNAENNSAIPKNKLVYSFPSNHFFPEISKTSHDLQSIQPYYPKSGIKGRKLKRISLKKVINSFKRLRRLMNLPNLDSKFQGYSNSSLSKSIKNHFSNKKDNKMMFEPLPYYEDYSKVPKNNKFVPKAKTSFFENSGTNSNKNPSYDPMSISKPKVKGNLATVHPDRNNVISIQPVISYKKPQIPKKNVDLQNKNAPPITSPGTVESNGSNKGNNGAISFNTKPENSSKVPNNQFHMDQQNRLVKTSSNQVGRITGYQNLTTGLPAQGLEPIRYQQNSLDLNRYTNLPKTPSSLRYSSKVNATSSSNDGESEYYKKSSPSKPEASLNRQVQDHISPSPIELTRKPLPDFPNIDKDHFDLLSSIQTGSIIKDPKSQDINPFRLDKNGAKDMNFTRISPSRINPKDRGLTHPSYPGSEFDVNSPSKNLYKKLPEVSSILGPKQKSAFRDSISYPSPPLNNNVIGDKLQGLYSQKKITPNTNSYITGKNSHSFIDGLDPNFNSSKYQTVEKSQNLTENKFDTSNNTENFPRKDNTNKLVFQTNKIYRDDKLIPLIPNPGIQASKRPAPLSPNTAISATYDVPYNPENEVFKNNTILGNIRGRKSDGNNSSKRKFSQSGYHPYNSTQGHQFKSRNSDENQQILLSDINLNLNANQKDTSFWDKAKTKLNNIFHFSKPKKKGRPISTIGLLQGGVENNEIDNGNIPLETFDFNHNSDNFNVKISPRNSTSNKNDKDQKLSLVNKSNGNQNGIYNKPGLEGLNPNSNQIPFNQHSELFFPQNTPNIHYLPKGQSPNSLNSSVTDAEMLKMKKRYSDLAKVNVSNLIVPEMAPSLNSEKNSPSNYNQVVDSLSVNDSSHPFTKPHNSLDGSDNYLSSKISKHRYPVKNQMVQTSFTDTNPSSIDIPVYPKMNFNKPINNQKIMPKPPSIFSFKSQKSTNDYQRIQKVNKAKNRIEMPNFANYISNNENSANPNNADLNLFNMANPDFRMDYPNPDNYIQGGSLNPFRMPHYNPNNAWRYNLNQSNSNLNPNTLPNPNHNSKTESNSHFATNSNQANPPVTNNNNNAIGGKPEGSGIQNAPEVTNKPNGNGFFSNLFNMNNGQSLLNAASTKYSSLAPAATLLGLLGASGLLNSKKNEDQNNAESSSNQQSSGPNGSKPNDNSSNSKENTGSGFWKNLGKLLLGGLVILTLYIFNKIKSKERPLKGIFRIAPLPIGTWYFSTNSLKKRIFSVDFKSLFYSGVTKEEYTSKIPRNNLKRAETGISAASMTAEILGLNVEDILPNSNRIEYPDLDKILDNLGKAKFSKVSRFTRAPEIVLDSELYKIPGVEMVESTSIKFFSETSESSQTDSLVSNTKKDLEGRPSYIKSKMIFPEKKTKSISNELNLDGSLNEHHRNPIASRDTRNVSNKIFTMFPPFSHISNLAVEIILHSPQVSLGGFGSTWTFTKSLSLASPYSYIPILLKKTKNLKELVVRTLSSYNKDDITDEKIVKKLVNAGPAFDRLLCHSLNLVDMSQILVLIIGPIGIHYFKGSDMLQNSNAPSVLNDFPKPFGNNNLWFRLFLYPIHIFGFMLPDLISFNLESGSYLLIVFSSLSFLLIIYWIILKSDSDHPHGSSGDSFVYLFSNTFKNSNLEDGHGFKSDELDSLSRESLKVNIFSSDGSGWSRNVENMLSSKEFEYILSQEVTQYINEIKNENFTKQPTSNLNNKSITSVKTRDVCPSKSLFYDDYNVKKNSKKYEDHNEGLTSITYKSKIPFTDQPIKYSDSRDVVKDGKILASNLSRLIWRILSKVHLFVCGKSIKDKMLRRKAAFYLIQNIGM
ncbi:hypothetical protein AYI68_g3881 [Smittium mucronatum]|uniref:Uncharacterized protein n=1 Tax=Smittium mucronatum TaxID=133383 RepID=A0A1R0GYP3_9FUNG|nr:hypothetical protein AYI68_g3881 [Smittium mucronatum]